MPQPMLNNATVVDKKWRITGRIGTGAFGETYAAFDMHTGEEVAVKVERVDSKTASLKFEIATIKRLQPCPHVVRYHAAGRLNDFNFMVMERLGDNIAELRKRVENEKFSLRTALKLGIQMLDSIEGVHNLGYVHRDIKPANFVMGRAANKTKRVYIIDFGLARKYRLATGEVRPPRHPAGFRGTPRYASINSHKAKDLGRRDDLWSLFYILVEFVLGTLPWKRIKDKDEIHRLKVKFSTPELVKNLPKGFTLFLEHIKTLRYADAPDYDYLRSILLETYSASGFQPDAPYDWEESIKRTRINPSRSLRNGSDAPIASGAQSSGTSEDARQVPSPSPLSGKRGESFKNQKNQRESDDNDFYCVLPSGSGSKLDEKGFSNSAKRTQELPERRASPRQNNLGCKCIIS
eukprot:gb/GECH01009336.1/.p1 GENE.gb/GECH01009336.1/~~gb/GECH01009336.1/.p1  ORF type:complete len:406 (+),score=89.33 gb/GECH01009336.1/:1-1218(+)